MNNVTCRDVSDPRCCPNKKVTVVVHVLTSTREPLPAGQFHRHFSADGGAAGAVTVDQELRMASPLSHSKCQGNQEGCKNLFTTRDWIDQIDQSDRPGDRRLSDVHTDTDGDRIPCFDEDSAQLSAFGPDVIRPLQLHVGPAPQSVCNGKPGNNWKQGGIVTRVNKNRAPHSGPRLAHPGAVNASTAGRLLVGNQCRPLWRTNTRQEFGVGRSNADDVLWHRPGVVGCLQRLSN